MSIQTEIIEYENHKILFLDMAGKDEEEILWSHPSLKEGMVKNKIVLLLLDTTNTRTTEKIKESSVETIKYVEQHNGPTLTALIGLRGIQKMIANAITKGIYFAKDREDGCRWLVANSSKLPPR